MKPSKDELMKHSDKKLSELADMYGCTKQNVSLWLKSYDIQRREIIPSPLRKINRLPIPPKEDLEYVVNLSLEEVGELYQVSTGTVKRWYENYGISRLDLRGYQDRLIGTEKVEMPSKEELEKHITKKLSDIGEIYGVSRPTVKYWFEKYGITRESLKGSHLKTRELQIPSKEELIANSHLTFKEIGEIYQVKTTAVWNWFRYYGLKKKQKPVAISKDVKQIRLDLVNKILNASDAFISALNTLLQGK